MKNIHCFSIPFLASVLCLLATLGCYMHEGGHGTVRSDWDIYLKFMKENLKPGT
jgi:hypothetical protein